MNHTGTNPPSNPKTKAVAIIPARYDSVRLPGKALLEIAGWGNIEFAYDASVRGAETISTPWDEALVQAVVRQREGKPDEPTLEKTDEPMPEEAPPKKRGFFAALRRS